MAAKRRGASGVQLGEDVVRAMVLQGAAKVFAERGVRLAGVEDIARRSGAALLVASSAESLPGFLRARGWRDEGDVVVRDL